MIPRICHSVDARHLLSANNRQETPNHTWKHTYRDVCLRILFLFQVTASCLLRTVRTYGLSDCRLLATLPNAAATEAMVSLQPGFASILPKAADATAGHMEAWIPRNTSVSAINETMAKVTPHRHALV